MTPSPSPPHSVAPSPSAAWTLTARWLFPVAGLPLERGTVTIEGERVIAVEPHGRRTADLDLGNAAILPGLVNAHTHLDLSGMRGLAPPSPDFTGWLRQVIAHRRSRSPEQVQADIQTGLAECLRCGTTLVGDISAGGTSWPMLAEAPLYSIVFLELLGLPRARAEQAWQAAEQWLQARPLLPRCRPGLSPHAPYSVSGWLLAQAALAAKRLQLPLAIHLAETSAELELLDQQSGPLLTFLSDLGVWDPDDFLIFPEEAGFVCHGYGVPHWLCIHGNYADPTYLALTGGTVVYCPRTHAAFGHPPHPFRQFLARGVRVALGTDSLASNPDLDVLAEARFLHANCPEVPGATILRMATLSGAEAFGWQDETGSLEPGKSADFIVLPLPDADRADPYQLVLGSALPVRAVMWRGRWTRGDLALIGGGEPGPKAE